MLERYHQTIKRDVNWVPYEVQSDLEAAIAAFVRYCNYRRYHMALDNVTPAVCSMEGRSEYCSGEWRRRPRRSSGEDAVIEPAGRSALALNNDNPLGS